MDLTTIYFTTFCAILIWVEVGSTLQDNNTKQGNNSKNATENGLETINQTGSGLEIISCPSIPQHPAKGEGLNITVRTINRTKDCYKGKIWKFKNTQQRNTCMQCKISQLSMITLYIQ